MNKKTLAMLLSRFRIFKEQNVKLEQYPTDPEIAADVLWTAYMQSDIKGKLIADLGCGHGILGIGALALGAKKVFFADVDMKALNIAKSNKALAEKLLGKKFQAQFFNCNVSNFKKKVDTVIENPPFGVKKTHMDKLFLLKAMEIAPVVYSFHKLSTERFVKSFAKDQGYKVSLRLKYRFGLKRSYWFHIKRVHYVDVGVWKLVKNLH